MKAISEIEDIKKGTVYSAPKFRKCSVKFSRILNEISCFDISVGQVLNGDIGCSVIADLE